MDILLVIWNAAEIVVKLVIAVLCAGFLGLPGHGNVRPAAIPLLMMISLGAALYIILPGIQGEFGSSIGPVVAQIALAAAFISAGVIIGQKARQECIFKAISMWIGAAIGAAAGMGLYFAALISAVIGYLIFSFAAHLMEKEKSQ